jgi:hypothetical protein
LRDPVAGTALALADGVFDLTGPAAGAVDTLYRAQRQGLIADIKKLRPSFFVEELGPVDTREGKLRIIAQLRARRAADRFLFKGELAELQVETIRQVQRLTDEAYAAAVRNQAKGMLPRSASPRMALGRYIDEIVRGRMETWFHSLSISTSGNVPVRINRRAYLVDPHGAYVRPDVRIGRLAIDSTLSPKDWGTEQVKRFFDTEVGVSAVVIVRPAAETDHNVYLLARPVGGK